MTAKATNSKPSKGGTRMRHMLGVPDVFNIDKAGLDEKVESEIVECFASFLKTISGSATECRKLLKKHCLFGLQATTRFAEKSPQNISFVLMGKPHPKRLVACLAKLLQIRRLPFAILSRMNDIFKLVTSFGISRLTVLCVLKTADNKLISLRSLLSCPEVIDSTSSEVKEAKQSTKCVVKLKRPQPNYSGLYVRSADVHHSSEDEGGFIKMSKISFPNYCSNNSAASAIPVSASKKMNERTQLKKMNKVKPRNEGKIKYLPPNIKTR